MSGIGMSSRSEKRSKKSLPLVDGQLLLLFQKLDHDVLLAGWPGNPTPNGSLAKPEVAFQIIVLTVFLRTLLGHTKIESTALHLETELCRSTSRAWPVPRLPGRQTSGSGRRPASWRSPAHHRPRHVSPAPGWTAWGTRNGTNRPCRLMIARSRIAVGKHSST